MNAAGFSENTSYADLGVEPTPITGPQPSPMIVSPPPGIISAGPLPNQGELLQTVGPGLIPLGGGRFFNPATGVLHGLGGGGLKVAAL